MRQHKNSKSIDKSYLHNSIQKHGWGKFKKEIIIDDVPEEDLNNLEISYIEMENTLAPNGYNLTLGGEGKSGFRPSKESREKMKQSAIRREANRDQFGTVSFSKKDNKYVARGPSPEYKSIGLYFTKKKAKQALNHFNKTSERIDSDRTFRKSGTGSIRKNNNGKRYVAYYMKNRKTFGKTFDTVEECEEWLKKELKF